MNSRTSASPALSQGLPCSPPTSTPAGAAGWLTGASLVSRSARASPGGEGDGEAEQVEAERQHPEQRHRDDVGRDIGRGRQHQARRHESQRDPVRKARSAGRRAFHGRGPRRSASSSSATSSRRRRRAGRRGDSRRSTACSNGKRQTGFDEDRIGDQPGKAAEIGRGVEGGGVLPLLDTLDQRWSRAPAPRWQRTAGRSTRRAATAPRWPAGVGGEQSRHQADQQPERRDQQHRRWIAA